MRCLCRLFANVVLGTLYPDHDAQIQAKFVASLRVQETVKIRRPNESSTF